MISGNCLICGSFFTAKRNTQKFCSRECNRINLIHKVEEEKIVKIYLSGMTMQEICEIFNISRKIVSNVLKRNKCKPRKRGSRDQVGSRNPSWKGGRYKDKAGYILIKNLSHPRGKSNKGYVYEHVLVAEKKDRQIFG